MLQMLLQLKLMGLVIDQTSFKKGDEGWVRVYVLTLVHLNFFLTYFLRGKIVYRTLLFIKRKTINKNIFKKVKI